MGRATTGVSPKIRLALWTRAGGRCQYEGCNEMLLGDLLSGQVRVELLSVVPLEHLIAAEAATWLDQELVSAEPELLRDAGFGKDVRAALSARRQWLIDEQLAHEGLDGPKFRKDMLTTLRRRELLRVATQMADELGLSYREAGQGRTDQWKARTASGSRQRTVCRHREQPRVHVGALAAVARAPDRSGTRG